MELNNGLLRLDLDDFGQIRSVVLAESGQTLALERDRLEADTDYGLWQSGKRLPESAEQESETAAVFRYVTEACEYRISYRLTDGAYLERFLEVLPRLPVTVYEVRSVSRMRDIPEEWVDYHTFWNCPTAAFLRGRDAGCFTGFANPFFSVRMEEERLEVSFEPAMTVAAGDSWRTEANFWGLYALSGERVAQQLPKTGIRYNGVSHPRYRNPSGHFALDRNEIAAFRKYAEHYLELRVREFKAVFYNFFSPLPQQPQTDREEELYYRYIDHFVQMGGDIITFNPLTRNRPPIPHRDSYWELAPEGSRAERILRYAKDKGLQIGFYMGSAPDNSQYCDSPMTEYASTREKPEWKKVGAGGEISRENCIADDDFAEWFFQVQKNTIEKYGITLWDWDPGPGNGFFCYSTEHGHIPGKGAYKGFYHAMRLIRRLRETFPELYIQGFHGTKEYGLWGFRGFDQHEAYWEQCPYDGATLYPDISEDRLTADGMRFQCGWNQNFRFLPAVINHSLAHRMSQCCSDPQELLYLFDHLGWKYAVMSALAAGASITVPMIPYDPDDIYGGYLEFFQKWIRWGKEHFAYLKNTLAFGDQVVCGTVDGYSKIIGDRGFLFLCNAAPIPSRTALTLDERIGFGARSAVTLKQIYPLENVRFYDGEAQRGVFSYGDTVHLCVPQYEVLVLEIEPAQDAGLTLYGIPGTARRDGGTVTVEAAPAFGVLEGVLCAPGLAAQTERLVVNGTEFPFSGRGDAVSFRVQYGREIPARYLYHWSDASGRPVSCPNRQPEEQVFWQTGFFASPMIRELLQQARPRNAGQVEELIPRLAEQLGREHFAWAQPHRLFLAVPFSDASAVEGLRVFFNGVEQPHIHAASRHYDAETGFIDYLDITDLVRWGEENTVAVAVERLPQDHFLGAYLYYPPLPETGTVTVPAPAAADPAADGPLYPLAANRPWSERDGRQARVDAAWIAEGRISEMQDYTLCASVNLPPEELEGVYVSAQVCIDRTGNTLKSDDALSYDPQRGLWTHIFHMGNRQLLIIDGESLYVWAVTRDHTVSPTYRVRAEWKLF